ncbi:MAG TPA: phosphate regulon sensor histidine kinase PhoR [Candidatus Dormibacteraeota bacterium]|nr:phosphate regulon sensor histidine kinase PhoR [Candidatus Dormibacteraeota bacterium]
MTSFYRGRLAALTAIGALALLAGVIAGPAWGWALCAAGLAGLLAYHLRHLARLGRWLAHPVPGSVPEALGSWDEVLTALHRFEREVAKREEMLADALARFRRAAQALPDGVVMRDAENRIEWCNDNAAAMLNLDPRADTGRPIANLVREPAFIDYLAAPNHDSVPAVRATAAQGVVLTLQLIPYGESQKLLLCRDVTQAERVETMRRDFVANVSHELRTPLTVLVGFLETVRELKLDPSRVRDYLGMMREQASRMHRIIEDLLTLSVLESAPPPPTDRVRMASLLARLRLEAEALSAGRHSILVEGRPTLDLLGSETELASAFGNLVSNAIRYTPAGGKVCLVWHEGLDGPSFAVEDTGPGIAPEHLPRLPERFYRVDRSRSRETGGTGLGLAIVKHAVARHQASFDIESKPGAGSRFTVHFPLQRTMPGEAAPSASHTAAE